MMIKDNGLYLGAHGGEGQWASQERLWSADSLSSAPPPRDILLAGRNVRHAWRCLAPLQPRTRGRLGARRRCGSGRAPAEKQVHPRRRFQGRTRCCCLLRGRQGQECERARARAGEGTWEPLSVGGRAQGRGRVFARARALARTRKRERD